MSEQSIENLTENPTQSSTEAAQPKPEILIVDDSKVIRRAAYKMLGDDYIVHEAVDGVDGWTQLQQNSSISVVFTDMQMPQMSGLELLDKIRDSGDDHISNLAVIMITGHDDTEAAKKEVFDHEATDFISKPFDSIDLISRAKSYARLTRKVVELEKQTGVDKLTGLFNVSYFAEQGEKALSFAQRHKLNIAVVHVEIDDFQNLYLDQGKAIAQQIIIAVGKKLHANLRAEDSAARIGVAKFALLLPLTNQATAIQIVVRMREVISKLVFDTGKEKIRVAIAAGVSASSVAETTRFSEIIEQADSALETAAAKPADKVTGFEPSPGEIQTEVSDLEIQQAFDKVLEGNYYQIPDAQLPYVMQRLQPFIEYVQNQQESQLTASGDRT
jgi:diguanylate cyclase (GGDEF)-like protein